MNLRESESDYLIAVLGADSLQSWRVISDGVVRQE